MPGVKILEEHAFSNCEALTDVECGKLEMIGEWAFSCCESLISISLLSARIVERSAFANCKALVDAKFGSKLGLIHHASFFKCHSLERITLPLKHGLFRDDSIFQECRNLMHVDLVEGAVLHETIAALHLGEWRNEMNEEIESINQILPNARAGFFITYYVDDDDGEKARAIQTWISSVLDKIIHYQAEHQRLLNEGATTLQHVLPQDIVINDVLSFLELPSHTFEVEEDEDNQGGSYYDDLHAFTERT